MNLAFFQSYCLEKKGVTEEFPFDQITLVYKVMGKIFAITSIDDFSQINLKCDPEKGVLLKEEYEGVLPAYHMNKKHWITVRINQGIPDRKVEEWIDTSYELVCASLTLAKKKELREL